MTAEPIEDEAVTADRTPPGSAPVLEVRDVVQQFRRKGGRGVVQAVSGVSLRIEKGESLGLVGETGSGKSTLARTIAMSPRPKRGEVLVDGVPLTGTSNKDMRRGLREMQMVFQDPFNSLNPKWRVRDVVAEPLIGHDLGSKTDRDRRVAEVLELVGLPVETFGARRPRSLSGGQAQRVAIARALAPNPSLIICDEAVSALDVVIQAQILDLLEDLRHRLKISYLFIGHDLATVRRVCDRVAVMYLGKLCELAPVGDLYSAPRHPYTDALLASIPVLDPYAKRAPSEAKIIGQSASAVNPPSGCRFRTRCPRAQERCALEEPAMRSDENGRAVACHFPLAGDERAQHV